MKKNTKEMMATVEILLRLKCIQRMMRKRQRRPMTIVQATKYTGLSKSFLYKLTSENKISHHKPNGKKVYFTKRDLDKYIFSNRIKTKKEREQDAINYNVKNGKKRN